MTTPGRAALTAVDERRNRRRAAAARSIERAALDLFVRCGFEAVSVDDVAAAAGISQRTFFRYFASKDDVLLDYRRRLDERLLAALHTRPADEGPVTALRNAYLATSTVCPQDRKNVLARARATAAAPALQARSRGEQAARTAELAVVLAGRMGLSAADARPRTVAAAMSAAAVAAWDAWVHSDGAGDPAVGIAAALDLIERGLGKLDRPAPGRTEGG